MTKKIWLSHVLCPGTPVYGGGKGFKQAVRKAIAKGDSCNTAFWQFPNHIGTHLDAPRHFFEKGRSIERLAASDLYFKKIKLLEVPWQESCLINISDISGHNLKNVDLLLIKTGGHRFRESKGYWKRNPGLSPELAEWLKNENTGLRAVGIDTISISMLKDRSAGRRAHRELLKGPILIIEDMDLSRVGKRTRFRGLQVTPLRVQGADGAPCEVVAEIIK